MCTYMCIIIHCNNPFDQARSPIMAGPGEAELPRPARGWPQAGWWFG